MPLSFDKGIADIDKRPKNINSNPEFVEIFNIS